MAEVLNVNIRETRGKRNSRRMRAAGGIDAVSVDGDDNIIRAETGIDLIDDAGERNTIG